MYIPLKWVTVLRIVPKLFVFDFRRKPAEHPAFRRSSYNQLGRYVGASIYLSLWLVAYYPQAQHLPENH